MKQFPKMGQIGVPVHKSTPERKPIRGNDFPDGIDDLDLSWFESRFTLERVAAATTPDALRVLQVQADFVLWLKNLQQMSKEA